MVKHAVSQFLINQFIKQQRTKGHLQAVSIYYSYSARSSDSVYNMYKFTMYCDLYAFVEIFAFPGGIWRRG